MSQSGNMNILNSSVYFIILLEFVIAKSLPNEIYMVYRIYPRTRAELDFLNNLRKSALNLKVN